jgi:hypothetical protein
VLILILLILAAIFFALATVNASIPRVNLVAAGLFCWVLTALIGHL